MPILNLCIISGISTLILSVLVIIQDHRSATNKTFFLFGFSTSIFLIVVYFIIWTHSQSYSELHVTLSRVAFGLATPIVYFVYLFFYNFPKKNVKIPYQIQILQVVEVLLLSSVATFTPLIHIGNVDLVPINLVNTNVNWNGPLYGVFLMHLLYYFLISTFLFIKKIHIAHGIEKTKLKIAGSGFIAYLLSVTIIFGFLPLFQIHVFHKEFPLLTLFFIIPTYYAIQKHRFFYLNYLSLKLIKVLLLMGLFTLTVLAISFLLQLLFHDMHHSWDLIISALLGAIILLKVEKKCPNLLPINFYRFKNAISELNSKIYYCQDIGSLTKYLEDTFVIKIGIKKVELYLIGKEKKCNINISIYSKDKFSDELESFKKDLLITDEIEYQPWSKKRKHLFQAKMKELQTSLCLPLFAEKHLIGFLILGKRQGLEKYTRNEVEELLEMRTELQISFMNILLKKNLQEENDLMKIIIEKKTKGLKGQLVEIKDLLSKQSDVLAITAHEFRTPLALAMLQLEGTLEDHKHTPEVLSELSTMETSLESLRDLISSLFNAEQFDRNKIKLVKTNIHLVSFLSKICEDFNLIKKKTKCRAHFNSSCNSEPVLELDASQIRRVIYNLLDNSSKFATRVTLELSDAPKNILIKVVDNGEGVPDVYKERIFEKFQTNKLNPKRGIGLGLGLYLCKKIIEFHGGEIWVEDAKGGGASFCMKLKK